MKLMTADQFTKDIIYFKSLQPFLLRKVSERSFPGTWIRVILV